MESKHDEKRYGDQYHCHKCGKQWDVNDPEPPSCLTDQDRINEIKSKFNFTNRP